MKKIVSLLLVASLGGLVAIGLSKLFETKETRTLEQMQQTRFASVLEPRNGAATNPDFVEVSEVVTPTVVHIITTIERTQARGQSPSMDPFDFFRDHPGFRFDTPQRPGIGSGSGVIISDDGYIVTNHHVIDNASKIEVILNDKRKYTAELIGKDPNTDLALIKIEEEKLPFAVFGNSDEVKVGQWVLAVGNPFNLNSTVTAGIVSAKGRNINLLGGDAPIEAFIQTDAAVNPGNSGGALISTDGKLIGINTAIATQTGSYSGYSFAVPANIATKVIDDILKYGEVQRGFLGIQIRDVDGELAETKGFDEIKGVYVAGVTDNSAAKESGIEEGDVITKVNDVAVNSSAELQEQVSKFHPGDKISVVALRDNKEKQFEVTLKSMDGKTEIVLTKDSEVSETLQAELESISKEEKQRLKTSHGIKVKEINKDSRLKKVGVPEGFVITAINNKKVYTVDDVKSTLERIQKGGILLEGINPKTGDKEYYGLGIE